MKSTIASFVLIAYGLTIGLLLWPSVAAVPPAALDWLLALLSFGGGVGTTHYYHSLAAAGDKKQLLFHDTILRALEQQFGVKVARDDRGELTGGELFTGSIGATLDDAASSFKGTSSSR